MRRIGWGKKGSKASSAGGARASDTADEGGVRKRSSKSGSSLEDTTDYGQFYNKINARGKCDDLVLLETVSNEGIVETLRNRYLAGDMYTSIGPVLIAVNPYKQLSMGGKGIYSPGVRDYYHRKGGGDFMAPHIYRIAAEAYNDLCADSRDQCVIVTGESGAGKTEAAKQLTHFVTTVGLSSDAQKATKEGVQRHLLESNPILEAFGNAQTIRNDNSSRFGKYMELQFTYKGMLRGGKVTNYLLEKSRVTGQADGERCFHVMYYLLQGTTSRERSDYGLLLGNRYEYLMREQRSIPGVEDGTEFTKLKASMSDVGIDKADQSHLFPLLGGVLAVGNIKFDDHGDGNCATVVQNPEDDDALARTAACFGVDAAELEAALTSVTLVVGGGGDAAGGRALTGGGRARRDASSWIGRGSSSQRNSVEHHRNLNGGDSTKSRDALAKEVYRRVFGWIVDKVNHSIECSEEGLTMGILDIYGFEIFDHNDFEQFCINYVNEKLQQYFIDHTIRAEQEDYETEGVEWEHVDYFNNKTVCDMIEGRHGLLSLLDEVSSYKDNDGAVLVNRYNRAMAKHDHYFPGEEAVFGTAYGRRSIGDSGGNHGDMVLKLAGGVGRDSRVGTRGGSSRASVGRINKQLLDSKRMFGIRHFAGNVTYGAELFIEKNADRLHRDLVSLMSKSTNPLAAELFEEGPADPTASRRHPSLSKQFKKQVEALCESLARCRPHYVRCIKPNSTKTPLAMDDTMITHQVKYLGLQENVRVRRQGYAYRMPFGHFVKRYGFLSESTWPDRVMEKCWPDGTSFDPANPDPPQHLIKYDQIEEEFQEQKEVGPDYNNTDSSDDGVTDQESRTPPPQSTPPRSNVPTVAKSTPGRMLQNFTPARFRAKAASSRMFNTPGRGGSKKRIVTVTSKRTREVPRPVHLVDRTVWRRPSLSDRQATFALLEEGKPKQWNPRLTGGRPVALRVPRQCADSGEIKMGKTKIFIKHPRTLFDLEDQRAPALFAVAVIIQRKARSFICRRRYLRFQAVIGRVAAVARGFLARLHYQRIINGLARTQAVFRGRRERARYARLRVAANGRPLRFYALTIQRNYRGYRTRRRMPRRRLEQTRALGSRMLATSRRFQAAESIQSVWRMYVVRKAFLRRVRQTKVVQACYRRHVARQQYEKMREKDYHRTLRGLEGGMTLVKHTVGSSFRLKSQRPVEFTYNNGVLSWKGTGMRREQGVNVVSDVSRMSKGLSSRRLQRTGEAAKGDGNTPLDRNANGAGGGGGKYLVLHKKSGKTLDLECADYIERDSVKRTLAKLRGEW